MGEPAAQPAISHDLPCPRCGYNLRGLQPDSRCPECAQSVALALSGNLLRYSNQKWIRSVQLGIWCEIAWLIVTPLIFIGSFGWPRISLVLMNIAAVVFAAACFFLSVPGVFSPSTLWLLSLRFLVIVGVVGNLSLTISPFAAGIPMELCISTTAMLGPALILKILLIRRYAKLLPSSDLDGSISLALWMCGFATIALGIVLLAGLMDVFVGFALGVMAFLLLLFIAWLVYVNAVTDLNKSLGVELDAANREKKEETFVG